MIQYRSSHCQAAVGAMLALLPTLAQAHPGHPGHDDFDSAGMVIVVLAAIAAAVSLRGLLLRAWQIVTAKARSASASSSLS